MMFAYGEVCTERSWPFKEGWNDPSTILASIHGTRIVHKHVCASNLDCSADH